MDLSVVSFFFLFLREPVISLFKIKTQSEHF